jgi:purine-binding chemotaxis protein CheW
VDSRAADPPADGAAPGPRVLTFRLDGRVHALDVGDVVEVVRMVAITPLPGGKPWIPGVLNHRGRVIPVIDLRIRLGLPYREPGLSTPIIVVDAGAQPAAIVVDEADDVIALPAGAIAPPDPGTASPAVTGLARHGKRLIVLLDAAQLCTGSADEVGTAELGGRHADIG